MLPGSLRLSQISMSPRPSPARNMHAAHPARARRTSSRRGPAARHQSRSARLTLLLSGFSKDPASHRSRCRLVDWFEAVLNGRESRALGYWSPATKPETLAKGRPLNTTDRVPETPISKADCRPFPVKHLHALLFGALSSKGCQSKTPPLETSRRGCTLPDSTKIVRSACTRRAQRDRLPQSRVNCLACRLGARSMDLAACGLPQALAPVSGGRSLDCVVTRFSQWQDVVDVLRM